MSRSVAFIVCGLLLAVAACDDMLRPEPQPRATEASLAATGAMATSKTDSSQTAHRLPTARPGDDPRAFVFEELGPPQLLYKQLEEGRCILHYRRGPHGYTPIPYVVSGSDAGRMRRPPVRLVMRRLRGENREILAVRAVCLISGTEQDLKATIEQVRKRIRQPGLERVPDGTLQLFEPEGEEPDAAAAQRPLAPASGLETALRLIGQLFARLPDEWHLGPTPLYAARQEDAPFPPPPGCWWVGSVLNCDDYGIDVPGEDPCDDDLGYWDDILEECVCYNGWDWADECVPSPPPPGGGDPPDPGGGGGPGDGDGDDDDGELPLPPCQVPTVQTLVEEYDQYNVQIDPMPWCDDFDDSGGTVHFSWSEYNGSFQQGNPHGPWGMVRQALKTGMEATRANYGRGGIIITSGYRCPHGNTAVGSDFPQTSRHMFGDAADMKSADHPWTEVEFDLLWQAGFSAGAELETWDSYPTDHHLHAEWPS